MSVNILKLSLELIATNYQGNNISTFKHFLQNSGCQQHLACGQGTWKLLYQDAQDLCGNARARRRQSCLRKKDSLPIVCSWC